MTLYILDPNLAHERGHHLDWDLAVARLAKARGEGVTIFAHKDFHAGRIDGIEVQRWFTRACYDIRDRDPVIGAFEDFRFFNDQLADDLARLPRQRFTARDAVWMPTLNEKHLLGYVSWIKEFDVARAPLFAAHLMFPSGLAMAAGETAVRIVDPLQALFYGLAFKRAREPGPGVLFFGGGRQLALEFSALSGMAIEPHPIPLCPPPRTAGRGRTILLYSGDLKSDKGFALVPGVADALCAAFPAWKFVVHANPSSGWGKILDSLPALRQVAAARPNLALHTERLGRDDYEALLRSVDALVCTYDPTVYARKSSGVLWEAIALGLPVLVPADTWLHREAALWGAGHLAYPEHTAASLCAGFAALVAEFETLAARSADAATRFQALNGPAALLNQIGEAWAPRLLASRMVVEPEPRTLPLDALGAEGLWAMEMAKGVKVRWTDRSFAIAFDWPHWSAWQVTVEAAHAIAGEQIAGAKILHRDAELPVRTQIAGTGGRIVCAGRGGGEAEAAVRLRVVLPWTFRPEGETRDLGIMLSRIVVGPEDGERRTAPETVLVKLASAVEWLEAGKRFRMPRAVSGTAVLDPLLGGVIAFSIWTESPADARALAFFVEGNPVPLDVAAADDHWSARATLTPAADASGNFAVTWDLAWPGAEAATELLVGDLRGLPHPAPTS